MINLIKKLLDYLYKQKCYFCSQSLENTIFCSKCYDKIKFLEYKKLNNIDSCAIYGAVYYKDIIKKLIRGVKYHNQKELAKYQAKLMFEYWKKIQCKNEIYTVVPVPLHKNRIKKRKYNHMDLVGEEFCKLTGYYFCPDFVIREKDTKPQYKLNKEERENNLKNAFSINKEHKPKSPILLIDDITTTGSTFYEIIKLLNKNSIKDVTAFATAIPEHNNFYIQ
ncbi:MAG: ComF family protein [Candidatus Gastranaerophilales bacterium]|nr:ComF family protein [Candidatus Gastranaerophilales bacterium]